MADTITTYDSQGQKLSFRDAIANVFPVDTPLYSTARNGKAINKLHQWQTEVLDTPGQNASVEGVDKADEAQQLTTEQSSYCQIFEKLAQVTDSNEAVSMYGRKSDLARQEMLKGKSAMNDIEYAYGHSQAGGAGSTSTRRTMKSAWHQIASGNRVTGTAGQGLTEADMLTAHQLAYDDGGQPSIFVIPSAEGTTVAGWATTATGDTGSRIRDFGTGKELVDCVELLVTPYGRMVVVLSRFQQPDQYDASADTGGNSGSTALSNLDNGIALLIDTNYIENAELRPMRRKRLATSGASERTLVDCEVTLACTSDVAHAAINFDSTA